MTRGYCGQCGDLYSNEVPCECQTKAVMKSQVKHKQDYFGNSYKTGLTFQHNFFGHWVDADPTADLSISPELFPEHWRVKEHVYHPEVEAKRRAGMSKKMYRVYIDDVETIEELIEFVKGMAASIGMQNKPALKIPEDMLANYPALDHLAEPFEEGKRG